MKTLGIGVVLFIMFANVYGINQTGSVNDSEKIICQKMSYILD